MGKGGPLAFLNKKPWHPGNIQNQEEIWKREQAFLAEVEKREELKRQIEEEREAEDNATQFQREKLGEQRVEWMYQGGLAAREDADKRQEEYLLGKAVDKLPDNGAAEASTRVDEVAAGSMPNTAQQFSSNETWSRLNADPMLTMKRVEMEKVKTAKEKAKIARLQAQIQLKAAAKLSGKDLLGKKHKKEKKRKKDKKDKSKHKSKRSRRDDGSHSSDSQSRSRSPSPLPPPPHRNPSGHALPPPPGSNKRPREDSRGRDYDRYDMHSRHAHQDNEASTRDTVRTHGDSRNRHHSNPPPVDRRNGYSKAKDTRSHRHSDVDAHARHARDDEGSRRERERQPADRERHRDRVDYAHDQHAYERNGRDRRHHDDDERGRVRGSDGYRGRGHHDEGKGRYTGVNGSREREREPERSQGARDRRGGDCQESQGEANKHRKEGYGLVRSHVPDFAKHSHRDDTDLTKRALEERAAAREKEEREEAERASAARRKHRPGMLTEEEKERRRKEMMENAADVQDMRMSLLRKAHDEDLADERREGRDTEEYLRSEERRVLLASSAVVSLDKRSRQ